MKKKKITSVNLSEKNLKYVKDKNMNVSDLIDYILTCWRLHLETGSKKVIDEVCKDLDLYLLIENKKKELMK